jgi:hypothetical protein
MSRILYKIPLIGKKRVSRQGAMPLRNGATVSRGGKRARNGGHFSVYERHAFGTLADQGR